MRKKVAVFGLRKGFDTEAKCHRRLERLRWPGGLRCPRCGGRRISKFEARGKTGKKRRLYTCLACRYQYTVTAGTLFHDSHLSLRKWFRAIFALATARKPVPALQLQRALRLGSYETAWSLARRIRRARERGNALLGKMARLGRRRKTEDRRQKTEVRRKKKRPPSAS